MSKTFKKMSSKMTKLAAEMYCVMLQIREAKCTFYATHHGTVLCKVLCYQIRNGLNSIGKTLLSIIKVAGKCYDDPSLSLFDPMRPNFNFETALSLLDKSICLVCG